MRLGRFLFQAGYTQTLARKSGDTSQLVVGFFHPEAPFGDGGPDTLLARYGIVREETAGTVEGEAANVDPEVVARWLADPTGGGAAIPAGTSINPPDTIDVSDLRFASRDGRTTAYANLLRPWLVRQPGGDPTEDKAVNRALRPGEIVHYVDPDTGADLPAIAYGTTTGDGDTETSLLRILRPKSVGEDFDVSAPQGEKGSRGTWHRPEKG